MKDTYKLVWSNEALLNLEDILSFFDESHSKNKIKQFSKLLRDHLKIVLENPYLFSLSDVNNIYRKAVLTPEITLYNLIQGNYVYLISLFHNRQNPQVLQNRLT